MSVSSVFIISILNTNQLLQPCRSFIMTQRCPVESDYNHQIRGTPQHSSTFESFRSYCPINTQLAVVTKTSKTANITAQAVNYMKVPEDHTNICGFHLPKFILNTPATEYLYLVSHNTNTVQSALTFPRSGS